MSLKMCKKECMTSNRKCQDSRYKQEAKKTDFHWRKGACQTPHCCYKSTPVLTSCVDNIPTVCAPRPLFSLLRLLVGLQPKHGPLFIGSLHISMAVASPPGSAAALASLRNKDNMFLLFREIAELCWWHHPHWTVIGDVIDLYLLSLPRSSVFSTPLIYKSHRLLLLLCSFKHLWCSWSDPGHFWTLHPFSIQCSVPSSL